MSNNSCIWRLLMFVWLAGLAGCTVHPPGEREERRAALQVGKPFEQRLEARTMQPLPDDPTTDQLVEYALLSNAELERHYWEWRAAIEQIPQDATQTATLNVAAGTSITRGHTSLGGSTLALSNDPMTDIKWPGKLDAAARQSLENARAAGHRFLKSQYELRNKVLSAYYDYALIAELIRLAQSDRQLLEAMALVTEAGNRAGTSGQEDLLKARNAVDLSGNDIANLQSQLLSQRAMINALLSRPAEAPLPVPEHLPPVRTVIYGDGELVELAARQNPELIALADEIRGGGQEIRLAKLQYVPDFNLSVGTDLLGVTQSLMGQATIPLLRYQALNAAVAQAEAKLRAVEAVRRQSGNDLAARVVADITMIRDIGRQLDLFDHTILPHARQTVSIGRSAYETGHASLLDLLDEQRSLIAIERLVAELRIAQATQLADLESITASDLTNPPIVRPAAAPE
jgi:cobalt-zinc-cadmium efflux system outer membrane protein